MNLTHENKSNRNSKGKNKNAMNEKAKTS